MDRGVEVLGAERRQHDEARAAMAARAPAPDVVRAAVDGDVEAARDEPRRELVAERLVAAVAARDAAAAEQGDARAGRAPHSGSPAIPNQRSTARRRRGAPALERAPPRERARAGARQSQP